MERRSEATSRQAPLRANASRAACVNSTTVAIIVCENLRQTPSIQSSWVVENLLEELASRRWRLGASGGVSGIITGGLAGGIPFGLPVVVATCFGIRRGLSHIILSHTVLKG